MHRIVASITTLDQHLEAVSATLERYRPLACPHCRLGGLWRHGCYHRKADHSAGGESLGPCRSITVQVVPHSGLPLTLHRHAGYDHVYYFIAGSVDDHLQHHARVLSARP